MVEPSSELRSEHSRVPPVGLPRATIVAYCAPMVGMGVMFMPFSIWLMKFSTDVLLIAPALFGALFMIGRIWDGISDPLVGTPRGASTRHRAYSIVCSAWAAPPRG